MSKFTKALEKVQQDHEEVVGPKPLPDEWDDGIATLKDVRSEPRIVMDHFPSTPVAEQYRMLRTSLKHQLYKQTGNVILISSAMHEEGKSITAANLAVAFAETGDAKVALVDADLRRGKLADYLGFGGGREGLANYLSNGIAIKDVMVRNYMENLVFVPRGEIAQKPSELVTSPKFNLMITELKRHFDYILVDTPPIMAAADAGIIGKQADGVLLVIQVGRTPKSAIAHTNILFKQAGVKVLGYALTHSDYQGSDYQYDAEYYRNGKKKKSKHLQRAKVSMRVIENRFNRMVKEHQLRREKLMHPAPVDTDRVRHQVKKPFRWPTWPLKWLMRAVVMGAIVAGIYYFNPYTSEEIIAFLHEWYLKARQYFSKF